MDQWMSFSFYLLVYIHTLTKSGNSWPLHNKKDPADKTTDIHNMTNHFHHVTNFTEGQFIWEGGSFPYHEPDPDEGREFYEKAILIAPIVGSIFLVIIVATGIYALRHYGSDTIELQQDRMCSYHGHDCKHKKQAKVFGEKMRYYVSKLWDNSNKSDAMFVKMEDRTRLLFGLRKYETTEIIV